MTEKRIADPTIWTPDILIGKGRLKLRDLIKSSIGDLEVLETLEISDPEVLTDWTDPETGDPGVLTVETAKSLSYRDMLYHLTFVNADKTPQRYRVNGRPQVWKTRPAEVRIPVKRGLYEYAQIWHYDLDQFSLSETFASLDHDRETDSEKLIKTLWSSVNSLQSFCMLIGDHIRDFESESGHTHIRPERLTDQDLQDLETVSRVSRGLAIFLTRIIRILETQDLEILECIRSSHVYLTGLFGDPDSWSDIGESLRELTVNLAGSLLLARPEDPGEIVPLYTDPIV